MSSKIRHYKIYQPMINVNSKSKYNNLFLNVYGKLKKFKNKNTGRYDIRIDDEVELHDNMLDKLDKKINVAGEHGWQPHGPIIVSNNKYSSR